MCTGTYNYDTFCRCFLFLFIVSFVTYLSGYGVEGAEAKRSILVPCPKETNYSLPLWRVHEIKRTYLNNNNNNNIYISFPEQSTHI